MTIYNTKYTKSSHFSSKVRRLNETELVPRILLQVPRPLGVPWIACTEPSRPCLDSFLVLKIQEPFKKALSTANATYMHLWAMPSGSESIFPYMQFNIILRTLQSPNVDILVFQKS